MKCDNKECDRYDEIYGNNCGKYADIEIMLKGVCLKAKEAPTSSPSSVGLCANCEEGKQRDIKFLIEMSETLAELKKKFGFVEGETPCACCKKILSIEDAHWAFGQWFHRMVKDCHK
jgi:hypothetical protein